VVNKFINYIESEKRYSKHTLKSYANDLNQYQLYLQANYDNTSTIGATFHHLRNFTVHLLEEGSSPSTVNRKISALKSYYKYLLKTGKIDINPTLKLTARKTPKKLPLFVKEQNINNALNSNNYFPNDETGTRDKLIVELFYVTGIRKSELIDLKVASLNKANSNISVLGKGNKIRLIPVIPKISNALYTYINAKEVQSSYIFTTIKGKKLYPKLVYNIVHKFLSQITTIPKKSPHILRHTFATHLSNNGAELNAIKELLGHASLAATQVYTHNTIDRLKEIHKQAHPGS